MHSSFDIQSKETYIDDDDDDDQDNQDNQDDEDDIKSKILGRSFSG